MIELNMKIYVTMLIKIMYLSPFPLHLFSNYVMNELVTTIISIIRLNSENESMQ